MIEVVYLRLLGAGLVDMPASHIGLRHQHRPLESSDHVAGTTRPSQELMFLLSHATCLASIASFWFVCHAPALRPCRRTSSAAAMADVARVWVVVPPRSAGLSCLRDHLAMRIYGLEAQNPQFVHGLSWISCPGHRGALSAGASCSRVGGLLVTSALGGRNFEDRGPGHVECHWWPCDENL